VLADTPGGGVGAFLTAQVAAPLPLGPVFTHVGTPAATYAIAAVTAAGVLLATRVAPRAAR
jgi:hypothetical protein